MLNTKDTSLTFWNDCSVSGAVLRGLLSCFTGHAAKHTGARREADAFLHVSVRPQRLPTSRQSAAGVRKRLHAPVVPTPLAAVTASASPRLPHRVCLPRQQLVSAVEPDGDGTLQPWPRHPASLAQRRPRGPRRPRRPLRGHAALCGCAPVRPFCSPWASGLFLGRNLSQMFPSVSGGHVWPFPADVPPGSGPAAW